MRLVRGSRFLLTILALVIAALACAGGYWYLTRSAASPDGMPAHALPPLPSEAAAKKVAELPADGKYYPIVSANGKSMEIVKSGKVVALVDAADLAAPFQALNDARRDEYQGIAANVSLYAPGPYGSVEPLPYDATRNAVYFFALDRATAGNENATRGLFRYDFSGGIVEPVLTTYGNGLTAAILSPSGRYIVYDQGGHGGACDDADGLEIYDLAKDAVVGATSLADSPGDTGYTDFGSWLDDTRFTYTEHSESQEDCRAEKEPNVHPKTYTITPK